MAFFEKLSAGLAKSRQRIAEQLNVIVDLSPDFGQDFWDGLEELLITSDLGAGASYSIVNNLQSMAIRQALRSTDVIKERLAQEIAAQFSTQGMDLFDRNPIAVLFVGINGSGKTTTAGKVAKLASDSGRNVLLGSADTFRAAAIEQLEVWACRADVPLIKRERGSDPASVCYEVMEKAQSLSSDFVLIDTAGRLHTSEDLMRELEKVVSVTNKRATMPVCTVLVIDATTGQNGLEQARVFNEALKLDGVIITKLDGTAKGGIAVAISSELSLPILKIGVGESIEDLRDFDSLDFAKALIG